MSFTYDPSADVFTDSGRIRLTIGDTVEDSGILPGRRNFSDQELDIFIELTANWQQAAVLALRSAATAWASKDRTISLEGYSESIKRANELSAQADKLETSLPGITPAGTYGLGSSRVKKITDIEA